MLAREIVTSLPCFLPSRIEPLSMMGTRRTGPPAANNPPSHMGVRVCTSAPQGAALRAGPQSNAVSSVRPWRRLKGSARAITELTGADAALVVRRCWGRLRSVDRLLTGRGLVVAQ